MVIALTARLFATAGTAIANHGGSHTKNFVNAVDVQDGSLTGIDIKNKSLTMADFRDAARAGPLEREARRVKGALPAQMVRTARRDQRARPERTEPTEPTGETASLYSTTTPSLSRTRRGPRPVASSSATQGCESSRWRGFDPRRVQPATRQCVLPERQQRCPATRRHDSLDGVWSSNVGQPSHAHPFEVGADPVTQVTPEPQVTRKPELPPSSRSGRTDAQSFLRPLSGSTATICGVPHHAAVIVAAAALLLGAESANGAVVTRLDRAGRPMTFDVRARGVNVNWYAGRLRGSIHGDEISDVVVRIVPPRVVARLCGGGGSCYSSRRGEDLLTVPAGRSTEVAHYLLHEYAHHLELQRGRWRDWEPWMERWWAARRIDALLAQARSRRTTTSAGSARSARSSRRTTSSCTCARGTGSAGSARRARASRPRSAATCVPLAVSLSFS